MTNRPAFLIIGAHKSGTTTIFHLLKRHPDLFGPNPKELRYFSRLFHRGENWYLQHFRDCLPGQLAFEATPQYTYFPQFTGVPERIAKFRPDMKLLYVVRDPVARIVSHYGLWRRTKSLEYSNAELDFANKTKRNLFVNRTRYMMQINEYRRWFPDDQIHCIFLEEYVRDPDSVFAGIAKFLGVKPFGKLPKSHQNEGPESIKEVVRGEIGAEILDGLADDLRPDTSAFLRYTGRSREIWPESDRAASPAS